MTRQINRLSARTVSTISKPGRHADGGGLYLVVELGGAKRWAFLFRWQGRLREMGLGGLHSVPLATARGVAVECRASLAAGLDPIEQRRKASSSAVPTFGAFTDTFIELKEGGWRNAKHRQQWKNTLRNHAASLRAKPVDAISTEDVLSVLKAIWLTKSETASRLRGRIEQVLDAARAAGHRSGENPARWKGHLDQLLPKRRKLTRGHHAAMPYTEVPAFFAKLRDRPTMAALALEFTILTAARSGETLGAKRVEVNKASRLWTVPSERMKGGREHRVPLCDRAMEILEEAEKLGSSDFIFTGQRPDRPLSGMALEMLLRRMDVCEATPHGFRSSFRDWAGELTGFSREIAEAALAHQVGDQTERAYRRGDALEKRRKLMETWARYCEARRIGEIVPLRRA